MNKRILKPATLSVAALFAGASMSFGQEEIQPATKTSDDAKPATLSQAATSSAAQPNEAEMMKQMIELSKLNDNHKLLASMAGTWNYTVKTWMDPKGDPSESTGIAVKKTMMDGRYVTGDYSGKFKMPGADGKQAVMNFKGMSLDSYDNVKQKFVSVWVDNMGTGVMLVEGTYDASTKTFTLLGEFEAMPGMKWKVREVIKSIDKDHMVMDYYEDRGQGETKSMEITYNRKK